MSPWKNSAYLRTFAPNYKQVQVCSDRIQLCGLTTLPPNRQVICCGWYSCWVWLNYFSRECCHQTIRASVCLPERLSTCLTNKIFTIKNSWAMKCCYSSRPPRIAPGYAREGWRTVWWAVFNGNIDGGQNIDGRFDDGGFKCCRHVAVKLPVFISVILPVTYPVSILPPTGASTFFFSSLFFFDWQKMVSRVAAQRFTQVSPVFDPCWRLPSSWLVVT